MSLRSVVLSTLLCTGCLKPVCPADEPTCDAGLASPDGGALRCATISSGGSPETVCVSVGPASCGGTRCLAGETCCFPTGRCFDPAASPAACPRANSAVSGGTLNAPCTSALDCGPDEACARDANGLCLGVGVCRSRTNCASCAPAGSPRCVQCGCDGVTYDSVQAACVAGVRTTLDGPCGTAHTGMYEYVDGGPLHITCGLPSQCPPGQACCGITGECYDPGQPWRCAWQPDGSVLDCLGDLDCAIPYEKHFCDGLGCAGPGWCRPAATNCGGEVVPVCGCNGVTYTNECWAAHAAVRVGSRGACDGG